ncbi:MAG: TM2 domain-containing protein [Clostridiales bacterium]|jgi:TM2 domain-containing membrane protein YozV|nr:TM2 domain-containing protein [Clostridiales bacterium]
MSKRINRTFKKFFYFKFSVIFIIDTYKNYYFSEPESKEDKNNKKDKVDPIEVERYILKNKDYFPENRVMYLKNRLLSLDIDDFEMVLIAKLISPWKMKIISFFGGILGIDRFMIKDIFFGILKLFTLGLFGILWFYDLLTINKKIRTMNFNKILMTIFN